MQALVFNGPKDIRYESFSDPELTIDNGVIVKVKKCSICGSDLHIYHGGSVIGNDYGADIDKFCVGHEFIGEVVEAGKDVHILSVGDQVLSSAGAGCGKCSACRSGKSSNCAQLMPFGLSAQLHGGQAEYVQVPNADYTLQQIPADISDEQAMLLTDGMATAFFGLQQVSLKPGDSIAIVGLGPIGLIAVELAFILGASAVYAFDPVEHRRKHAEHLGATAYNPGPEAKKAFLEKTEGKGANCVFEASGAKAAVDSVLGLASKNGAVSFIGVPQPDVTLSLPVMLYKNLTVRAGLAPVNLMWNSLIPLLQHGKLKAEGLFSHEYSLSEGSEAYRVFDQREDNIVKVMINVD